MSLNNLKIEMIEMIELSAQIGQYNQVLLHCSDFMDKRNYDAEKGAKVKTKLDQLHERLSFLKEKWFGISF